MADLVHLLATAYDQLPHHVSSNINLLHKVMLEYHLNAKGMRIIDKQIENPRVGGSNPSPGTTYITLISLHKIELEALLFKSAAP
ncbi:hypothetical protein [Gemmobacter aquaticus]|uniref:hypothetical protein n=1 Tax=Gemmobacter aquaticus TaxID=490185 RepID=UPI0011B6E8BD|nr:hypothetical protein [Gemmobacter aquaticus]